MRPKHPSSSSVDSSPLCIILYVYGMFSNFCLKQTKDTENCFCYLKRKDKDTMDKYWYIKIDNSTHLDWLPTTFQLNTKVQNDRILFYLGKQGHLPATPFPQTLSHMSSGVIQSLQVKSRASSIQTYNVVCSLWECDNFLFS